MPLEFFCGRLLSALGFALGAPFAAAIIYPLCPSSLPPSPSLEQQAAACHASGRSVGPLIPFIPHKTPSLWRRNRPIARSLARSRFHLRASEDPLSLPSWHFAASPIEGRRMICFPEGKFAFTRNLESAFLIRSVVISNVNQVDIMISCSICYFY